MLFFWPFFDHLLINIFVTWNITVAMIHNDVILYILSSKSILCPWCFAGNIIGCFWASVKSLSRKGFKVANCRYSLVLLALDLTPSIQSVKNSFWIILTNALSARVYRLRTITFFSSNVFVFNLTRKVTEVSLFEFNGLWICYKVAQNITPIVTSSVP